MKTRKQISRFFIFISGLLALVGCGGSGSSGFDARFDQEQQLITRVNAESVCEESNGTLFCSGNKTGDSIGKNNEFSMIITAQSEPSVSCVLETNLGPCGLKVGIQDIKGFQSDTQYFMAVRYQAPFSTHWEIVPSPFVAVPSSDLPKAEIVVPIRGVSSVTSSRVDLAVLAYPSGTNPATSDGLLSSFKARVAFVVTDVTVTPQP